MIRYINKISIILATFLLLSCSEEYLDIKPLGTISEESLSTPDNANALVTAAYATLTDNFLFGTSNFHDFVYGGIRSDDAYKGGAGPADVGYWHPFELYNIITPDNESLNSNWTVLYDRISRCDKALVVLDQLTDEEMPLRQVRMGEMHFLRGHYFFTLKRLFKNIVYFDETATIEEKKTLSNKQYSNDELWDKIANDFQLAYDNLIEDQPEVGRANKYAAAAYLAKTRLYQAYEQDENHNVVNINEGKLQEVIDMADVVINSGKYSLFNNFGMNFTYGYDNGVESIFAIQYSINDGTESGKLDFDHMLNYNMGPGYGCCWFNIPSQNLVIRLELLTGFQLMILMPLTCWNRKISRQIQLTPDLTILLG